MDTLALIPPSFPKNVVVDESPTVQVIDFTF